MAVVIIVYTRTLGIINLDETIIEQFTLRRRWALHIERALHIN